MLFPIFETKAPQVTAYAPYFYYEFEIASEETLFWLNKIILFYPAKLYKKYLTNGSQMI